MVENGNNGNTYRDHQSDRQLSFEKYLLSHMFDHMSIFIYLPSNYNYWIIFRRIFSFFAIIRVNVQN